MSQVYTGKASPKLVGKIACLECSDTCIHSPGQRATLRKRLAKKLNAEITAAEDAYYAEKDRNRRNGP